MSDEQKLDKIGLLKEREKAKEKITADDVAAPKDQSGSFPVATKNDLQWGRRIFHFASGTIAATGYALFLKHQQVVYLLGIIACTLYLAEQIRIAYPEISEKLTWINRILLRAEEQLKESTSIPYAIAILLTILTFPKAVALIAIYSLAIGDPMAAIIGIKFGKHRLKSGKSLEGSAAFFVCCFGISLVVLSWTFAGMTLRILGSSVFIGLVSSIFEGIPFRIDDNLTIPLFTAATAWSTLALLGFL